MSLAWSPDDSQIATCSSDKSVRVWTVADGVCRQTFTQHIKGVSSVAWMPDSTVQPSSTYLHASHVNVHGFQACTV